MARRPRRSPLAPVSRRLSGLALAGAAAVASTLAAVPLHAAELGEPRVASHIGQPLVADIELTMLEDPAAPVQVRLASREVYNGAGIAVPPALSTLNLSVMRRDGRQFLHATTLRAVEGEHLHLYLELVDKGQRVVRLATLWLTPDPNPAPPPRPPAPAPAPLVAPLAPSVAAAVPAPAAPPPARPVAAPPAAAPVRAEPKRIRLPAPVPKLALPGAHADAHAPSCQRQSEDARTCTALGEKNADLRAQLARLEDKVKGLQAALGARQGEPAQAAPAAPSAALKPAAAQAPAHAPAANAPAEVKAPAANAVPAHDGNTQAAPDAAHAGKGDAAHAGGEEPKPESAPPKPETKPAGPKPIHAIKPLVPRKPKEKEAQADGEGGLPWGWIGGALALLGLGAGGVAFMRRNRTANVDIPAPGLLARLRQRLAARGRPAPAAAAPAAREAEPTLE